MASTSTIKTNCYNFLNTIIDNKFERNTSTSSSVFDEFAETRSRSTRAASLALPNNSLLDLFDKEQTLLNPVNLKPTTLTTSIKNTITSTVSSLSKLRRHSTSASCEQEEDYDGSGTQPNGVFFTNGDAEASGVLPLSNENLKLHQRMSRKSRSVKSFASGGGPNPAVPPVPKRNIHSKSRASGANNRSAGTPTISQTRQKSYSVDQRDSREGRTNSGSTSASSSHQRSAGKFSSLSSISGREDDLDGPATSENDDRMSVESSVFEDTPPYTAPLMARQQMSCDFPSNYDENSSALLTKKMLSSNRSSSDSNKSQITIDTGYMSSTTSTTSAITNNTESAAERATTGTGNGTFRSRFSSEDTQSSLDSFMSSSEPQNQQRYVADYSSSYGTANPSPSYLQTGGTSSYYLAAGTNDVIEYLQKYSARNYPNSLRTPPPATANNTSGSLGNSRQRSPSQQQVHKSSHHPHQISGCSSSAPVASSSPSSAGAGSAANNNPFLARREGAAPVGTPTATITSSRDGVVGGGEQGSSISTSATNSMTSLSPSANTTTSINNNSNNSSATTSLLKLTPPPSATQSATLAASQSVSLSGTGVTTITATTTISTATQPRNTSAPFGQKSYNGSSSSRGGGLASIAMPLCTQVSFDSAKILQTGQILGAKITQHFTGNRQQQQQQPRDIKGQNMTPGAGKPEPSSSGGAVNPPRRGLNGILNKPPPLTQIHHTKVNQRQDSNISSDSFSITSSPGYNCKSMEAPLLQHTSKIHRSVGAMKHQDSSDSFNMTMRCPSSSANGSNKKFNVRQDSTISSDSFSQTSSPGYNSKLMDAPLLAHAAKMHKSE